jgi:Cu-processing system ATP-binding protein
MTAPGSIQLVGVSKRFGACPVLRDVSLEVEAGECVALIGHNGAGKTTLMKLVLGLTRPSAGTVSVSGRAPYAGGAKGARRDLGYLPENVAFQGGMSGRETLRFYARLKRQDLKRVDDLLDEVGLEEAARRPFRTYAKGMRQRLGLAQAMLGSPRLLVLDEPTSGLDPSLRREFYERVRDLRQNGTTTLISSHSLAEIEGRTDRIAVLREGQVVAYGSLEELRNQARVPIQIRVSVRAGSATRVATRIDAGDNVCHVNDHSIELACFVPEKMDLLRRIAAAGDEVCDVDVLSPPLDEIYRHFSAGHDAGQDDGEPRS